MITTTDEARNEAAKRTAEVQEKMSNVKETHPDRAPQSTDEAREFARIDNANAPKATVKETHPNRAPQSTDEAREFARIDRDNK